MKLARARATFPLFFSILLILVVLHSVHADILSTSTSKPSYVLGATINIYGTLTLQGNPVTDGLVAVQIEDDEGNLRLIRVVCTGEEPAPYEVRIVQFLACDYEGNPKTSFECGQFVFFKVIVESLASLDVQITIFFNLFDSVGRSFILPFHTRSLKSSQLFQYVRSFLVPPDFLAGTAKCYVNVLTGVSQPAVPKFNGCPCCPEESVEITISGTETQTTSTESSTSLEGFFQLSFKLPDTAALGAYDVYTRARYNAWASTAFDYYWRKADVNRDGQVNILDISRVAKVFGSRTGDSNYDDYVDLNKDNWINILDISAIAIDFGKIMS